MDIDELIPKIDIPEGSRGPWSIVKFEAKPDVWAAFHYASHSRHYIPGNYTKLMHGKTVVMSDTPDERRDHVMFVMNAQGPVLIGGLGLGMCLQAVLKKPEVTEVTILEIDQNLIDLIGPHYKDSRVTIICADALEWKPPKGKKYGAVWFDIWDTICIDNRHTMATLNRRYGGRSVWKGCWAQDIIRRMQKQEYRERFSF